VTDLGRRSSNWWIKTACCEDNEVEATMARTSKAMPTSPLSVVIQHLLADVGSDGGGVTDGELLARFVRSRDDDALAALVRRHAPMVWGVCRRLLNHHDAEDAFQATFLVLVRKAAQAPRQAVANWLYGVARQTAVRLRATAAKRGRRERQAVNMSEPTVPQVRDSDLQMMVDEELNRLPDHYRGVIVLCDLEGLTRKAAGRQLGIPEGSVASRLARARVLLAKRLTQRGVVFSSGSVAAVLSAGSAASAPPALVASTIKAASLLAAGQAAGVVSVRIASLTEGVVKAMFVTKIKSVLAVMLVLGFMATGAMLLTDRTAAGQGDKKPTAEKPVEPAAKQEKEKETFTAWGKEVGGLQAGLGYRPGEKRAYRQGDTVKVVVRVRNVGKEEVKFQYFKEFFAENPPTVTDGEGKPVDVRVPLDTAILHLPVEATLKPGTEMDLYEWHRELKPGKYQIQYERVFGNTFVTAIQFDPALTKLATGKLELEVKDAEKAPQEKEEKETAWGKEVDGLQVGLGFRPGERRVYRHGETVTLVLRVRNVSHMKMVPGPHWYTFPFEGLPAITDADGKRIPIASIAAEGPRERKVVELAAGKEIDFCELKLELRPASESAKKAHRTLYGMGKFQIQYERVTGEYIKPVLIVRTQSKLATGKLELEVRDAEKVPGKKDEKEAFTAWGKEVGGLQAGLGYASGQKRAYSPGETVKLVVRVRNVGKEEITFRYAKEDFFETPPAVTDAEGKPVSLTRRIASGFAALLKVKLAPGKEIELAEVKLEPRTSTQSVHEGQWNLFTTGKFTLWYEQLLDPANDKTLSKLATGKLELEVRDAEKLPEKKQEKEGLTAWGKEVDGLQAGLGFRPGAKRPYTHGETVKLVVRVRNVSKKEVNITSIPAFFFDRPPSVTDGEGKAAPQLRLPTEGDEGEYNRKQLSLAPGQEVELAEVRIELRPESERDNKGLNTLYGTGKFLIQYERLMYESGKYDIGSILSMLATGKVELEIKAGPPASP
jgi:RNA polymerase sigma factor (sigma-70 family)